MFAELELAVLGRLFGDIVRRRSIRMPTAANKQCMHALNNNKMPKAKAEGEKKKKRL